MKLSIHATGANSLKAKRQVVRSVKDRVKSRFNVSIAEVDDHDLWQRVSLGIAVVASDAAHADSQLQNILSFISANVDILDVATELVSR